MQPTTHGTLSQSRVTGFGGALHAGLRIRLTYGLLILALGLMIADCYRLAHASAHSTALPAAIHSAGI